MKINNISLKELFISGVAWTFIGFGLSQLIRLLSTFILARLLSPEDYGLMAIVTVIQIGVVCMFDIGINKNILQNHRSDDEDFLNAAWTLQVAKGILLWLICLLLSWPIAHFYGQPILFPILIVASFALVISGLNSTGIYTNEKSINLKKQTLYQVLSQAVALIVMLIIAYFKPTVWALVVGGLTSASIYMLLSHTLTPVKNKIHWDTKTIQSLFTFGKWIMLSSTLGFIVNYGSTLILGRFLSLTEMGLFSIGVTLSKAFENIFSTTFNKVVLPIYEKIKSLPNNELRKRLTKLKLSIIGLFLPTLLLLAIFSHEIVGVLFDERYKGAAWILQLFSICFIPMVISGLGYFYIVLGNTKLLANTVFAKTIVFCLLSYIGWHFNNTNGIIFGIALSTSLYYFIDLYPQIKYNVWLKRVDLIAWAASAFILVYCTIFTTKLDAMLNKIGVL